MPHDLADDASPDVLRVHPHGRVLLPPLVVLLAGLVLVGYAAAALPPGAAVVRAVGLVAVVAVLVRFSLVPWLRWLGSVLVLEPTRLQVRTGVLRRRRYDVPLWHVRAVHVDRSPVQRLFRSGTLVVDTGGAAAVVVRDVPDVRRVAEQLADRVDRLRRD